MTAKLHICALCSARFGSEGAAKQQRGGAAHVSPHSSPAIKSKGGV